MHLDQIDRKILKHLQRDASISNLDLAEAVGLSPTPCSRRVKRLEDEGIILRRVTILDQSKLNLSLTALISVTMDRHTDRRFSQFEQEISTYPEVLECSVITGQDADLLVRATVPDMAYYEKFLLARLTRIEGVSGVHSSFILRSVVNRTELPLDL